MPAKRKTLQQEVAEVMATGTELAEMTDAEFDAVLIGESPEDDFLGDVSVDTHALTVIERPQAAAPATVGAMVQSLLMDPALDYESIVARVLLTHPSARTTVRSVASTASVMRKKGTNVPMRRKGQA